MKYSSASRGLVEGDEVEAVAASDHDFGFIASSFLISQLGMEFFHFYARWLSCCPRPVHFFPISVYFH